MDQETLLFRHIRDCTTNVLFQREMGLENLPEFSLGLTEAKMSLSMKRSTLDVPSLSKSKNKNIRQKWS